MGGTGGTGTGWRGTDTPSIRMTNLLFCVGTSRSIVDRMGEQQSPCVRRATASANFLPPDNPRCRCPRGCGRGSPDGQNGSDLTRIL